MTTVWRRRKPLLLDFASLVEKVYLMKNNINPMAWGVPNTRIVESQPFMMLLHSTKDCQYPEMLVPLFTLDQLGEIGLLLSDDEIHDAFQQKSKNKVKERRLIAEAILKIVLSKQKA